MIANENTFFQARAQEWLFAAEEGQGRVVESAKAARLIMVCRLRVYLFAI